MAAFSEKGLGSRLSDLRQGMEFRTPDNAKGVVFDIRRIEQRMLSIARVEPRGTEVNINLDAFFETMRYLTSHGHDADNPIEIRSNNSEDAAGPLCRISRAVNDHVRCINYVIPILADFGYVGMSGRRPNTCWYV